jgi:hypothetical protein
MEQLTQSELDQIKSDSEKLRRELIAKNMSVGTQINYSDILRRVKQSESDRIKAVVNEKNKQLARAKPQTVMEPVHPLNDAWD